MKRYTKVDLSRYDLNEFPVNPMLIHKIQDGLSELKGEDMWTMAIKTGAQRNVKQVIKTIISAYQDNPPTVRELIGKEILGWIEEYEGITLADDIKNIL